MGGLTSLLFGQSKQRYYHECRRCGRQVPDPVGGCDDCEDGAVSTYRLN